MSSRLVGPIGRRKSSSLVGLAVALAMLVGGWAMAVNLGLLDGPMRLETPSFKPDTASQPGPGIVDTVVLTALQSPGPTSNRFAIAGTAVVELRRIDAGLALTSVEAEPGWAWSATDEPPGNVAIEFESDDDTMTFSAALDNSGSVVALVQSLNHGRSQTTAPAAPDGTAPVSDEPDGTDSKSTSSSVGATAADDRSEDQSADRGNRGNSEDRAANAEHRRAAGGAATVGSDGDERQGGDEGHDGDEEGDDDGRYDDD